MAKSTDEFIKENVPRGTSSPKIRGVSSLKGYGEGGEETEMIRKSAREVLRALVGVKPYDETNPTEAYRMASTPTPLAALGIFGRRGLGIIDAAKASKAFKGKGLDVAEAEQFSVKKLMDRLKEQGLDVDRTWLRGKKDTNEGFKYSPKYDYLEALYEYQKRPDAVERALKEVKTGRPWSYSGTLSRQSGDRDVTKYNTKGGVWLTESPTIAESYSGDKGFIIPVLTRRPEVVLDAKGEQWDEFFKTSKEFKEAQRDPNVKSVEVKNIIDFGGRSKLPFGLSDDELRELLTANNLFLKKPFVDKDVVSKLTGEPFPYQDGGSVNVPRGTSEVPRLTPEGELIDEREEIRSESQRMLNRLQSQPSKLPPGIRRTVAATREQGKESMFPAAAPARDLLAGILGASPTAPGSQAYRTGQAIANMPPVQAAAAIPAKIAASAGDAATALAAMGPAMGAVVKRKGGNWLANAISDEMQNLKVTRFDNDPVDVYEDMKRVYTPEVMSRLSPETLQQVKEGFAALKPQVAINKWIDTKLAKYMQNEFATPEDPVRALIERGISPARNPGDINPIYDYNNVFEKRKEAGFPVEGLAETEAGRNWEEMADSSINVSYLKNLLSSLKDRQESKYGMIRNEANRTLRDNPWLNKLTLPYTPIYGQLGANYRPVFNHVIDELQNAMATNSGLPKNLQLDPDDLSKMNVPQVVELVDKINKWRVDNIKNLQLEETLKADLYKAYPEQKYRWVQLNRPGQFAAESDAMGHSVRGYEPPDKGGSEYYGLGGFKAIQSGEAKVYSLRDEKGQPHVTIEVSAAPGAMSPSEFYHSDLATQSLFDRLDKVDEATINRDKSSWWEEVVRESPEYQEYLKTIPSKVTQIKGKGNEAPAEKYWAFAQDFVKSGNWSDVQDLRNIGLRKTSNVFNETDIAKLKAMGEDVPNYVSGRDILRLQDLVIPEGMRLKYDNAGNIIGRQNPDYFGFKDGGSVNVPRGTSTSKQQLDKLAQVSKRKKA